MKRPTTKIGLLLQSIRQERNLKQEELSKRSGIPQATISRIESGKHKTPLTPTLLSLAKALSTGFKDSETEIFLKLSQALNTSVRSSRPSQR